jgi:septal ring factor EnvC (AmiA/AmiB activator)
MDPGDYKTIDEALHAVRIIPIESMQFTDQLAAARREFDRIMIIITQAQEKAVMEKALARKHMRKANEKHKEIVKTLKEVNETKKHVEMRERELDRKLALYEKQMQERKATLAEFIRNKQKLIDEIDVLQKRHDGLLPKRPSMNLPTDMPKKKRKMTISK